jgi:cytochrome oxidase Cu insertion factor (SCO1/SenC/PrrC family)
VALQNIELIDQDGRDVGASSLSGQVLVLSFMFTSCPTVCPKLTRLLADTRAQLPDDVRDRVRFLSVSVDPDNDAPEALKAFAKRHGADVPEWRFVRVHEQDLQILASRLVVFEPGTPRGPAAHNLTLYLFDRRGRLVQRYSGTTTQPEQLAREIVALDGLSQPTAHAAGEPARRTLRSTFTN